LSDVKKSNNNNRSRDQTQPPVGGTARERRRSAAVRAGLRDDRVGAISRRRAVSMVHARGDRQSRTPLAVARSDQIAREGDPELLESTRAS